MRMRRASHRNLRRASCPWRTRLSRAPPCAQDMAKVKAGLEVWKTAGCPDCHGAFADGEKQRDEAPDGANLRTARIDDATMAETIRCGRPGTGMPRFDKDAYTAARLLRTAGRPPCRTISIRRRASLAPRRSAPWSPICGPRSSGTARSRRRTARSTTARGRIPAIEDEQASQPAPKHICRLKGMSRDVSIAKSRKSKRSVRGRTRVCFRENG